MQRPVVEVDRFAALLKRAGQPAVSIVAAVAPALVVLLAARRRRRGIEQHLREAPAVPRLRGPTTHLRQRRHAGQIEQRWHDIGHVHELRADRAAARDPRGPRDDKRHTPAAAAGVGLVRREGRVRDLTPAGRIQGVAARSADEIQALTLALDRVFGEAREAAVVVDRADRSAGVRAAIVRREHDDRVVALAHPFEERDEPAEILVGAVEHRRVGFHVPREQRPIGGLGVVPGRHHGVRGRQPGSRRDQAQLQLAPVSRLADAGPALVVAAAVLGDVLRLGLERRVHRVVRDVEKERLVGRGGAVLAHEAHRLLGPVVGGVVVPRVLVDREQRIAEHQPRREEEVGLAFHEAVEVLEATLRRPGVLDRGGQAQGPGRVVPLADHHRRVSGGAERFGQGRGVAGDLAGVAGKAGVVVGEPAGADRVGIAAGEERGARGRADRMRRVVIEAQAARGQRVDVRRLDLRAEASRVGIAHVVHVDDHDVGRARAGAGRLRPPRLGFRARSSHRPPKSCRVVAPAVRGHRINLLGGSPQNTPPS